MRWHPKRQRPRSSQPSDNGIESDNDPNGSDREPRTAPVIYNATLCGRNDADAKPSYGLLIRRGARPTIVNSIVTGFHAGVDLRDRGTELSIASSILADNVVHDVAYPEQARGAALLADDDFGFDEDTWFRRVATNATELPRGFDCTDARNPRFGAESALTERASAPPDDGFFQPVDYMGAVRDAHDTWYRAGWTRWNDR